MQARRMEDAECKANACKTADNNGSKFKPKTRGKKRKRIQCDSGSESDDGLPENALEVEKNLIASAAKNNLDDVSVKKILKKVVTNDHVLALVKLREEEESNTEESQLLPKLTRAKVKELNKVSPKTGPWNLQNLELTPIKHIPVKTRPEVKALIAQELPEDEDDEEYEPAHDDVPSDDDQCTESCSDVDSQPRTPATPRGQQRTSPKVVKDGPFKVPQDISTPARRKLELEEEEATIALRTRSKLCLSETPIEHIESSFVPPDELPVPAVTDHIWNEFLNECLNPASVSKHEDDDETDPEYNVAADQDAPEDDDELERSIIKISKKELNDLVTELFNIIPEQTVEDELADISDVVLEDTNEKSTQSTHWEGKQEPTSDDEVSVKMVDRIVFERRSSISHSVGKTEPTDVVIEYVNEKDLSPEKTCKETIENDSTQTQTVTKAPSNVIDIEQKEGLIPQHSTKWAAPASVRHAQAEATTHSVLVLLDSTNTILPEQIQILQQQLRQHIQVATSNFLQLCVHPIHWALGPTYKEYLLSLKKIGDSNPDSVVKVCNLQPAVELAETWEATVSKNTPENAEMVAFVQKESDRCMRRLAHNNTYVGMFHEMFQRTVAHSRVFLYPYLLPCVPAREGPTRRSCYSRAEDELIVLGLDQFWDYVDNNPQIYKKPTRPQPRKRWGLSFAVDLVVKHMLPWLTTKVLMCHIQKVRLIGDKDNPIVKFFTNREVVPVKHVLLPYNPSLTLYEQPEYEMPRIWLRYLAKTSKRFRKHLYKPKTVAGKPPVGVEVRVGLPADLPPKKPLPIQFTKEIVGCRLNVDEPRSQEIQPEKFNIEIQRNPPKEIAPMLLYKLVETSGGITLIPHQVEKDSIKPIGTNTVNCNVAPISSTIEVEKDLIAKRIGLKQRELDDPNHCKCCIMLRSIRKTKQKAITDYFKSTRRKDEKCRCSVKKYPKITNRLRLLVDCYKIRTENIYRDLKKRVEFLSKCEDSQKEDITEEGRSNADDIAFVTAYLLKLTSRSSIAKNFYLKRRINNLFSKFDPDADNPIVLARSIGEAFKVELVDLFVEFLSFLTPEQAAMMGKYRQYFTLNCLEDLVEKVEEHVKDKASKLSMFTQLSSLFAGLWSPCQICSSLLPLMALYPPLAEYTFSLFPHWCRDNVVEATPNGNATSTPGASPRVSIDKEQTEAEDTLVEGAESQAMADYEADHSSSGEEDSRPESVMAAPKLSPQDNTAIPVLPLYNNPDFQPTCKTEPTDCDSSEMSMMIMSEDEPIKTEPPAWKRDEDKLILEVLKANLTPEERKDKTIAEILEEKEVLEALAENLLNKTTEEVKERMVYLLNVLLLGETCGKK